MKKLRKGLAVDILGMLQSMFLILLAARVPVYGSEQDALWISNNIQALHMPYKVIIDPVLATPTRSSALAVEATPPFGLDITWLQSVPLQGNKLARGDR